MGAGIEVSKIQTLEHLDPQLRARDVRLEPRILAAIKALAASNISHAIFTRSLPERAPNSAVNAASTSGGVSLIIETLTAAEPPCSIRALPESRDLCWFERDGNGVTVFWNRRDRDDRIPLWVEGLTRIRHGTSADRSRRASFSRHRRWCQKSDSGSTTVPLRFSTTRRMLGQLLSRGVTDTVTPAGQWADPMFCRFPTAAAAPASKLVNCPTAEMTIVSV